ncbi:MAG: 50S ribosomal protein L29 [Proteobacteria bacterium]|jgi:large subunit ribosomal protein L29|nr:50S ribosomal protein L29 [Pseudomonadota bacterium]
MMKYSEAAKMSKKDILEKVAVLKTEMFNAKFSKHTVGVDKPHTKRVIKKDIARLLTAMNAKKN